MKNYPWIVIIRKRTWRVAEPIFSPLLLLLLLFKILSLSFFFSVESILKRLVLFFFFILFSPSFLILFLRKKKKINKKKAFPAVYHISPYEEYGCYRGRELSTVSPSSQTFR